MCCLHSFLDGVQTPQMKIPFGSHHIASLSCALACIILLAQRSGAPSYPCEQALAPRLEHRACSCVLVRRAALYGTRTVHGSACMQSSSRTGPCRFVVGPGTDTGLCTGLCCRGLRVMEWNREALGLGLQKAAPIHSVRMPALSATSTATTT